MPVVILQSDNLRVGLFPQAGAGIVSFDGKFGDQWKPLMRPTPDQAVVSQDVSQFASFNLAPWSNRILNASFNFAGQIYRLHANTPQGFAIHGDVRTRPWRVVEQTGQLLTCQLNSSEFADINFPFPFTADLRYELTNTALTMTIALTNTGDGPMPAGFGFHPYFNRGFGAGGPDEVSIKFHATGIYSPVPGMAAAKVDGLADSHRLPNSSFAPIPTSMDFSRLTSIGTQDIDHCYGGWNGRATIDYPSHDIQLHLQCDPVFSHVILYTPPGKPYFALEPVSHANDGFNLYAAGVPDTGVQVLESDKKLYGSVRILVTPFV